MEDFTEATISAWNMVFVGGQSNGLEDLFPFLLVICTILSLISVKTQAVLGQRVVEENHDSVAKKSLVSESVSKFDMSSNGDEQRQNQNPPIAWREPKRGRKILTTSLLLKRKKKITRRHKHTKPVLRLRGGGDKIDGIDSMQDPELRKETNRQCVLSLDRPSLWTDWELERQVLRPLPLDSARRPDLAYLNMTVDEVANEDGIEHFDLAKDVYRRSDAQVQIVREAQRDQRRVAGGIYQCQEEGKETFYLHIMKGPSKLVGIKLVRVEPSQRPSIEFETFAEMDYERYVQCSSQRVRVNLPEETETGFVWYGHGGNKYLLSSSVYKFCERVDNDIHYSSGDCERVTEAPGASQLLCSNESCGVIFWHLTVIFFHRVKANHFEQAGQEHFAVMLLKSGEQVLLWTDKAGKQTRWTRLEHSHRYENVQVLPGSLERIRYVVAEGLLPNCHFSLPAYSPVIGQWEEPQPLKRIPPTCNW